MKARLIVFPIKGRNWCFSRPIDRSVSESKSAGIPVTLKDLWKKISFKEKPIKENAEVLVDFASEKMNRAWIGLEKAPDGTLKNKIHGLGLRLLARVKPSEVFLKSISKEVTKVEVTYPTSLSPRLVRRRLRHIAMRGTIIHSRYFYGSVSLLPLSSALAVLPLPNIPFFWILFRAYSHWKALKGGERLLLLVSDGSNKRSSGGTNGNEKGTTHDDSSPLWVMQASKELDGYLHGKEVEGGLSNSVIYDICKAYDLEAAEVVKYRNST